MDSPCDVKKLAQKAKACTFSLTQACLEQKNSVLEAMRQNIQKSQDRILEANRQDIASAKANGLNPPLLERLSLENKLPGILDELEQIIALPDPVGEKLEEKTLPNNLQLARYRTPIGVLGIIYESRPNVTIDVSALSIKSGNCAILRGGSETIHTNKVLVELVQKSLASAGLPSEAIAFISNTDKSQVQEMLKLHEYIDLIIPRGSESLQEFCRKHSTIAVITGGVGICHLFVDETADLKRSLQVILNAKTQRPTVCNALDTLLVHQSIAGAFIPQVVDLLSEKHVTFRLDPLAKDLVFHDSCTPAGEKDWDEEWLSLVLGIKVVNDMQDAINHIRKHSTGHSDGILTETKQNAEIFIKSIDSAAVYVNASTRFTDGAQFGLGAEVAISTQKLHARGPMSLKELTSYKWVVKGDYQVRS